MQLTRPLVIAISSCLFLFGCSDESDEIVGVPPFANQLCEYKSLDELIFTSKGVAEKFDLRYRSNVMNADNKVFSLTFLRPGLNIIVSGVPTQQQAFISGIKSGVVNSKDKQLYFSIRDALLENCVDAKSPR